MPKILIVCLCLYACSSVQYSVESNKLSFALADEPRAQQSDGILFAKLKKENGQWQLVSMASTRMPVDLFNNEERVCITVDDQEVMPDFDFYQYYDGQKQLFDCGKGVKYKKNTSYNPCTSVLTSNTKFGQGLFGWTKQLDITELNRAVTQSRILEKAGTKMQALEKERLRCRRLKDKAEQFVEHQQVGLRVIDQTGMYPNGHEFVSYKLEIKPEVAQEGCEQSLDQVMLSYNMNIVQDFDLMLELREKLNSLKFDNNVIMMQQKIAKANKPVMATLVITGKAVNHYNLYKTFSNDEVKLVWRSLDIGDTDLHQTFDISNISNSDIEVKQVWFYVNEHVIKKKNTYHISASAKRDGLVHASRYFLLNREAKKSIEAIKVINSNAEQAVFGVKIFYTVNGELRTFTKKNSIKLSSVL